MTDPAIYRLSFPPSLELDQVVTVLAGLAHDLQSRAPRPVLVLRLAATQSQIVHELEVSQVLVDAVLGRLRSAIPSLRVDLTEEPITHTRSTVVTELNLRNLHRPLRIDRSPATAAALLTAVAGLHRGERIEVVWRLAAARTPAPARQLPKRGPGQPFWSSLLRPSPASWHQESEAVRQERLKQGEPLLLAQCQIAVWSGNTGRASLLLGPVLSALRSTSAPGVALTPSRWPQWWLKRRFQLATVPNISWPIVLNAAEAAGLIGWPIDSPQVPGLALAGSRQLAPVSAISSHSARGVVVADATFPGLKRPIVLRDKDRLLHTHVIGPTGVGKSTLLASMILADAGHGHGLIVIDPGKDLVSDVLDRLPKQRHQDVIVLDPSDRDHPVGLNPLQAGGRSPDLVVEQLVGVIRSIFSAFWGPRSDDILRIALLSLSYARAGTTPYTLVDVPTILTNPAFRRTVVGQLKDPILLSSWAAYEGLGDAGRAQAIGPVLNKLRAFLLRPALRNILAQAEPGWSIEEIFSKRKILLVPLSSGELGEDAASLLGALLVARIWQAAQGRSALEPSARRPVMLYLDEFQTMLRLPTKIGEVLAQARKLGLGLTLAHQHLGQLSSEVRNDVLANARSRIIFQLSVDDARVLAKFLPQLSAEDLQLLPRYEVVAHLAASGVVVPPATGRTRPLPDSTGSAARLREHSRQTYGRPVAEIEADLIQRATPAAKWDLAEVPIGMKPLEEERGGAETDQEPRT